MSDRTGYVMDYRVELLPVPGNTVKGIYYRVTIADNKGGTNPDEYVLIRNIQSSAVDRNSNGPWAMSYGSLELAVIATLKDALINQLRVTVTYDFLGPEAESPIGNYLRAVRLHQS